MTSAGASLLLDNMQLAFQCIQSGQPASATLLLTLVLSGLESRDTSDLVPGGLELAPIDDDRYDIYDEIIKVLYKE